MDCPNGWLECDLCKHKKECDDGDYKGEITDIEVVIKAAEVSAKVINAEVRKSVESIRGGSWFEEFSRMSYNDRMREVARYHPPDLHAIADPYKAEQGAIVPGGGGKCRVPKKPQKKIPEYLKTFGQ